MVPGSTLDKTALGHAVKAVFNGPKMIEGPGFYPSVNQIALAVEAYLAARGDTMGSPLPIQTYHKPTWPEGDRILVFGLLSLTPEDHGDDPTREWHCADWSSILGAFAADGEGFIVDVTHWMPLPASPTDK